MIIDFTKNKELAAELIKISIRYVEDCVTFYIRDNKKTVTDEDKKLLKHFVKYTKELNKPLLFILEGKELKNASR